MENPQGGGRLSAMGLLMLAVVAGYRYFPCASYPFWQSGVRYWRQRDVGEPDGDFYSQHHYSHLYALHRTGNTGGDCLLDLYQAGYALAGVGVELDAIASVVIGGTLLSGGVGTVLGTLLAWRFRG